MTTEEYNGLYGEVVTNDCYRLRTLDFTPDFILDIGANVGVFSRFARELFPDAFIVSVEPHPANIDAYLKNPPPGQYVLLPIALGRDGQLWHNKGAVNGSGESYVSSGLGYDENEMRDNSSAERSTVRAKMLPEIIAYPVDKKAMIKIDCEGGENVIWEDEASMEILKQMDYIAMETHFYAQHGGELYEHMKNITLDAIGILKETHHVDFNHPYFFARKK